MKQLIVLGLVAALLVSYVGCGKTPPPPPPEQPAVTPPVDTTPVDTMPAPPPPPPMLKAEQLISVYFDFDKFDLRADTKAGLDVNYDLMQQFPNAIIKIEGHCDERGTVEYNMSLGDKRARAAMDYLVNRGIPANRLSTISYGKERPIDMGHSEEAWQKNRRCEFKIVSQ